MAKLQGNKCHQVINEETKHLMVNGSFNPNAAWNLKKKIFPKSSDPPFAIYNKEKQLVTDSKSILEVMKDEFAFRLRNREINPEYEEMRALKEYLCHLRLEITKRSDFFPWSMKDLEGAICRLKNNKCKDPHGHVNELYKCMGEGGLKSLLTMLNRIKEELLIPANLQLSNVSTIYKGKGSKQDVINLRGIFKLPIVRNILDRLIYLDDKDIINHSMGQYQVGNQQNRNIRDHTLIVHAIINEAQENKHQLDILFTDIKQCFDSIWLEEAINDLYDSGINTRNLNLLFEGNKETNMLVETKFGQSQRTKLDKIVMQGSVTGGTFCSNQLSKICNRSYKEGHVYMYDGIVPVPPLAMVDDIMTIVLCNSAEGLITNVTLDSFIQMKKLESQVGDGKCQWLHIGDQQCPSSYVANRQFISQCKAYKYLGDHVSDGWDELYLKRYARAQGYAAKCQAMSTEISLGVQIYSVAKLLHEALFLNGSLVNMETWPNCSDRRMDMFERAEQSIFRRILAAHSKTPVECLYLELGVIPFRYHLMARRVAYYQVIMNRSDDEITKAVVARQKISQIPGDFYVQVLGDMTRLNISESDIKNQSKTALKKQIDQAIGKIAFEDLLKKAKSHSKVREDLYSDLKGMEYMKDPRFTTEDVNTLFRFRTRMFNVKNNFRNQYRSTNLLCPLCETCDDSQEHLFECSKIKDDISTDQPTNISYSDLFTNDCNRLLQVSQLLEEIIQKRVGEESLEVL